MLTQKLSKAAKIIDIIILSLAIIFCLFMRNFPLAGVIFIFGGSYILYRRKRIQLDAIIQGILIGAAAGLIISFFTDGDFRANIEAPFIEFARVLHIKWQYVSKNWVVNQVTEVRKGIFNITATNIATGSITEFNNAPLSTLPPDLRYTISSGNAPGDVLMIVPQKAREIEIPSIIMDETEREK